MSEADYFGFELVFKSVEQSIQTKSDVLIAVVHWYLIKNSFRNVGLGDDVSFWIVGVVELVAREL